jgi:transaldolase
MSLRSLITTGTKLWLDSIDPDLVQENHALGASGATSNPIIISDLIKTGRFDEDMIELFDEGSDDKEVAWLMTDSLVHDAQEVFFDIYNRTYGDNGYVSFELDPLLEDRDNTQSQQERTSQYIELAKQWSMGHMNRMIKVPATPAGLAALEEVAAAGVTVNVTLIFTERQYKIARDAIWRGAQRSKGGLEKFKSVYSIFISRVDVYTEKHVPDLSPAAQGQVGIINAKRLWQLNQQFWADKNLPLKQEIIFASTGVKKPNDPPDKYVEALAGSDIMTNPPATNDAVERMQKIYRRTVDQMPPQEVLAEIDAKVDQQKMEDKLMEEGTAKFAEPFKGLLKLIAEKRASLSPAK